MSALAKTWVATSVQLCTAVVSQTFTGEHIVCSYYVLISQTEKESCLYNSSLKNIMI
jgi:hypothetical protein